jgi:AcrR family transcriptional regulator
MMSQVLGLRERQKQLTRELIADTARRLFGERGFEAVTVAEVAREAGVSEKTVFNYFPTKEDLFYSRMESFEEDLLEAIRNRGPSQTILDAFVGYITTPRGFLASAEPDAGERLYAVNRLVAESPALLAREERIYAGYTRALAELIAAETGAHPDDVAPWVAANAMMGVHRALIAYVRGQTQAGERDPKRIARRMRAQAKQAVALLQGGLP